MSDVLSQYLELSGSTTRFLESISGGAVRAQIHAQERCDETNTLSRVSTLHIGDSAPILAARCRLNIVALTEFEVTRLTETNDPIGAVLLATIDEDLRREDTEITGVDTHSLVEVLAAVAASYHLKTFNLWQAGRFIGKLEELVCEEALKRAVKPDLSAPQTLPV